MRTPTVVAIIGGILFAVGIVGTILAAPSASSRNRDPYYLEDCLIGTPEPSCPSRTAALEGARTVLLGLELTILVGLVVIVVAFVMDVRTKRKGPAPPER